MTDKELAKELLALIKQNESTQAEVELFRKLANQKHDQTDEIYYKVVDLLAKFKRGARGTAFKIDGDYYQVYFDGGHPPCTKLIKLEVVEL